MCLLLIGTGNDVVMLLLSMCVCVCGGDGCVGDTTNACTMYRVLVVWCCGCPFGRQGVRVVDRLMYSKPFIIFIHSV